MILTVALAYLLGIAVSIMIGIVEASRMKAQTKVYCWLAAIILMIGIGVCLC